ncbi:hypothetical protein Bca4012_062831 [Brassica carinata]
MSAAMDKALMAMSLEEEDVPFVMPDLPEYSSSEWNVTSLIGRLLNPDFQRMESFIYVMPRKWQKQGKVRGVALSRERFQFIFDYEHDLIEILEKGVHTYKEWAIVLERWSEVPPVNSLQHIPIWVQIRNIPLNYYTQLAIEALGDIVSPVMEVAFDPTKAQCNDFVRVKVNFDVSRPLRKEKVIDLRKGNNTSIYFHYERVQKRCYTCQRLTHEQAVCPINVLRRQSEAEARRAGQVFMKKKQISVLTENDPLYGVLDENQVGIDPNTGRQRIAAEVLEGMRQYLFMADGNERKIREDIVKRSVREVEKDPVLKKSSLSLEPIPSVTHDLNKGKGIVFDYSLQRPSSVGEDRRPQDQKLMAAAIKVNPFAEWNPRGQRGELNQICLTSFNEPASSSSQSGSTGYSFRSLDLNSSGTNSKNVKARRRPSKNKRKMKGVVLEEDNIQISLKEGSLVGVVEKRKATDQMGGVSKAVKQITHEAVPKEGLSNDQ